jgi:hypothetical protein
MESNATAPGARAQQARCVHIAAHVGQAWWHQRTPLTAVVGLELGPALLGEHAVGDVRADCSRWPISTVRLALGTMMHTRSSYLLLAPHHAARLPTTILKEFGCCRCTVDMCAQQHCAHSTACNECCHGLHQLHSALRRPGSSRRWPKRPAVLRPARTLSARGVTVRTRSRCEPT